MSDVTPVTTTLAQPFKVVSDFSPAGDQPKAIAGLAEGIDGGERFQTLLGITGSGKSATIAWTIEQVQRPTLVLAPNKSLAAQLANEFKEFFPDNAVEYFVSLLRLLPARGVHGLERHLHREGQLGQRRDRAAPPLHHGRRCSPGATSSWSPRCRCIYGLGSPEEYRDSLLVLRKGETLDQRLLLRRFVDMQYDRNDMNLTRGKLPGAGRHHRDPPRLRRDGAADRAVRRRDRGAWPPSTR